MESHQIYLFKVFIKTCVDACNFDFVHSTEGAAILYFYDENFNSIWVSIEKKCQKVFIWNL